MRDEGARARSAGNLGQAVGVLAEVGQLALERPEELGGGMGVQRRRAAAGGDGDLHDAEVAGALLVGGVELDEVLHHEDGGGGESSDHAAEATDGAAGDPISPARPR
jgi:hypothetical protein